MFMGSWSDTLGFWRSMLICQINLDWVMLRSGRDEMPGFIQSEMPW